MSNDNIAPAPAKKFVYPFPIADTSNGHRGGRQEATDPQTYYSALAQAEDGFYPIGYNGQWHGGIHFGAQTGQALAQEGGVRCIADGEVIAWRIDDDYPTAEYSTCAAATYSRGFVLVRHRLQLPPAPAQAGQAAAADGDQKPAEPSLVFYSLYMHLLNWKGYQEDAGKARPAFWGEPMYLVGERANDADRSRNPHIPDGGVGLNLRNAANHVVGFAPRGTQLRLGARRGTSSYYTVTEVVSGALAPPGVADVHAFRDELNPMRVEPPAMGEVVIPDTPTQIAAGDLVGYLGQYQRYSDMNPLGSSCTARPLAQLDVFASDDFAAFIAASRQRALLLPESSKTLLLIEAGARLVMPASHATSATAEQLAGARTAGDGPVATHPRMIPVKALDAAVTEEDGTRWWQVNVGDENGNSVSGWVRERDHANVRLCTPWDWPGFEIVDATDTTPSALYARHVVQQNQTAPDERSALEEEGRSAESGTLFSRLHDLIDTDNDHALSPLELRQALRKPWLAQALSHMIVRNHSEWSGPMDRWNAIDGKIPDQRKEDWEKEKQRIESLLWWGNAKGQHGLPGDVPLVAHNIHPIGFVANFACNCRCVNVDAFIENYRARHGDFSNSPGQPLDIVSEEHLRILITGIVEYYQSQNRECFLPHVAYMLATARHETLWAGVYFEPRTEGGSRSYFNKYDPVLANTQAHRDRAVKMENTSEGDGYRYRGRGYVQLTWKVNYRRCGEHLGLDLIGSPDLALDSAHASGCMLYGMHSGLFTGARITRYVNETSKDYFNARRVINGTDKAALIERYAELFEEILEESKC